jgi:3-deoxy-D-manno-octulosonic-acid transferase
LVLALLQRPAFAAWRCVFVPHDPSPAAVERLLGQLGASAMRYSAALAALSGQPDKLQGLRHLVVDSVGLLNQLYRHARVAYIGGGFGKGIHNTLEPAAFGLPVVFGPRYRKFEEACQLVARGAAFPVEDTDALADALLRLSDAANYRHAAQAALGYLEESRGATEKAIAFFQKQFPDG